MEEVEASVEEVVEAFTEVVEVSMKLVEASMGAGEACSFQGFQKVSASVGTPIGTSTDACDMPSLLTLASTNSHRLLLHFHFLPPIITFMYILPFTSTTIFH